MAGYKDRRMDRNKEDRNKIFKKRIEGCQEGQKDR